MSNSLRPHELQHTRPPCPSPAPRVHSNSHPLSRWCHPAISSSVVPFSSAPNPSQHQSLCLVLLNLMFKVFNCRIMWCCNGIISNMLVWWLNYTSGRHRSEVVGVWHMVSVFSSITYYISESVTLGNYLSSISLGSLLCNMGIITVL